MKKLNVEILKLARESRGITQEELAVLLKIEQGTLSKIEKSILNAEEELLLKISELLDYPLPFFYLNRKVNPIEGHYRRKTSIPVKLMKQHIAQMTIVEWHFITLIDDIDLPILNLPSWNVEKEGSPEMCARFLREYWRLPRGRVDNLTKFIEDNGIAVIALDLTEIDGFSTYINGQIPVIFVNRNSPPDRYRLSLAHELGHLMMHFHTKVDPERDTETESFAFGIEFLVPENSIRPYLNKLSLEKLADLKSYWKVSMAAMLKYASDLGTLTTNQSRYLWTQMGTAGYRKREPVSIAQEKPGLISEILETYLNDLGYTIQELANILYSSVPEIEKLYLTPYQTGMRITHKSNLKAG